MNQDNRPRARRSPQSKGKKTLLIIVNLLAMGVVGIAVIWLALGWLNIWTGHGKELVVPDVKGQTFENARLMLEEAGLSVELADSVYDDKAQRGAVVDQNPKVNTRVKPGRTIYLTINAFSPKTVSIPNLTDISSRQARSILEGLGIKDVVEEMVISEYKNLVLGARYNGKRLTAGARVPVNARIILEVGDGMPELPDSVAPTDSVAFSEEVSFF